MTTIQLPPDFKEFLKSLAAHNVRFLIVGGYAVNAYGYVRNTTDLDIWIAPDDENRHRVILALRDFAFPAASDDLLAEPDAMIRMGVPPLRIEVMCKVSGAEFEECWARRTAAEHAGVTLPLISRADLIRNKRAAGRPQDLLDADELD